MVRHVQQRTRLRERLQWRGQRRARPFRGVFPPRTCPPARVHAMATEQRHCTASLTPTARQHSRRSNTTSHRLPSDLCRHLPTPHAVTPYAGCLTLHIWSLEGVAADAVRRPLSSARTAAVRTCDRRSALLGRAVSARRVLRRRDAHDPFLVAGHALRRAHLRRSRTRRSTAQITLPSGDRCGWGSDVRGAVRVAGNERCDTRVGSDHARHSTQRTLSDTGRRRSAERCSRDPHRRRSRAKAESMDAGCSGASHGCCQETERLINNEQTR